jgi:hypothetical protein
MKKTSRRNFAKSVAGAIAAIPIVSVAASGQRQSRQKRILNHENTPPPISIDDGSLDLRIKHPDDNKPLEESGQDRLWYYRGKLNGARANSIEHVKVLDGAGEKRYMDLNATGSVITITLKDESDGRVGELRFREIQDFGESKFEVRSTGYGNGKGKGQLSYSKGDGKPARKHKWKHQGGDGPKDFRIVGINITGGSVRPFNLNLPPVSEASPFENQEFRVLIWLAHPHPRRGR